MTETQNSNRRGRPAITDAQRTEMRQKIAEAAARLFKSDGFGQVSMRRIAADVGCSPMSLYTYYDAKIDILRTLWAEVFEDLFMRLDQIELETPDPETQLHSLASAYLNFWLDNPALYRLVFMAEGVTQPDVSVFVDTDDIAERYTLFAKPLIAISPEPMDAKTLKMKLDALICFLHGIAHNRITISQYDWAETDALIDMAIRGVIAPSAR